MFLQSNLYPTLLYIVFFFFLAFLPVFFLSSAFIFMYPKKKTKKKNPQKYKQTYYTLPIFNEFGGVLCELRGMLVSVVGVGIHWLEPIMRMLYVQCMEKNFDLWLFLV